MWSVQMHALRMFQVLRVEYETPAALGAATPLFPSTETDVLYNSIYLLIFLERREGREGERERNVSGLPLAHPSGGWSLQPRRVP